MLLYKKKYNILPYMKNIFLLRFKYSMNKRLENILLKVFLEDYDLFNKFHSSKLIFNNMYNLINITTKILSIKTKSNGLSSYNTSSL